MKYGWVVSLGLMVTPAWSQAPGGDAGAQEQAPTRMMMCQAEVQGAKGDRKQQLRACLARRLEGERLVARDCKRQVADVTGTAARQQAQKDCERRALAVASNELPKRPPPPKRPKPAESAADAAPADSAPPPSAPAAGEQ